jgi:hypothetical protein
MRCITGLGQNPLSSLVPDGDGCSPVSGHQKSDFKKIPHRSTKPTA